MKTKYLVIFIALSFLIISSVVLIDKIFARGTGAIKIQYPVEELGNCENETSCGVYCDKPDNIEACVSFAEKNNLMSEEEVKMAKKFIAAGAKGPGGCTGKDSCEAYCNDISRIDECVSFAEKNGLLSPEELEEAKKVQSAIKRGVKPPPCGNKKACDAYCEDSDHMEECITFGAEAGFIQGKELEDAQKMLQAVKRGVKAPPCKGKEACDEYCSNPDNMELCMNFAMEAGFMSEQEKADAQKMLEALKKGVKPPNCRGKEKCDVYCAEEEHFEECVNFAEAAGFMTSEDAQMARKTGGKGPGNCRSKEECEAFCNNPDNQETCFNFAKENGMIPEEDIKRMEEGKQQFKEAIQNIPPEVYSCLESMVGVETMAKFKSGEAMPPKEIGDKMRDCFEKNMPPPSGGPEGGAPGNMVPGTTGPGGCANQEECQKYCESNPEACNPPTGGQPPAPPASGGEPGYAPVPPMPCEGSNCPPPPPTPGTPGSAPSGAPGTYNPQPFTPPSTAPGGGGSLPPGEYVPPAQPTSFLDSLLGLIISPFKLLLR